MASYGSPHQLFVSYQQRDYDAFAAHAAQLADELGGMVSSGAVDDRQRFINRCFSEAAVANDLRYITCLSDLGLTPPARAMSSAAQHGYADILRQLLRNNTTQEAIADALAWGALGGQEQTVRMLLDVHPNAQFDFGLLTMAVRGGNMDVVDLVQNRSAQARSVHQKSTLFLAACISTVEMLNRFIDLATKEGLKDDEGLEKDTREKHPMSPHELILSGVVAAAHMERIDVLTTLMERNSHSVGTCLLKLCTATNQISADVVAHVLPYTSEEQRYTALEHVVRNGRLPLVQLLVAHLEHRSVEKAFNRLINQESAQPAALCVLATVVPMDNPHTRQQIVGFALKSGNIDIIDQMFALVSWDSLNHIELGKKCAKFPGYPYYQRMLLDKIVQQDNSTEAPSRMRKM